ncbi:hypothetical protein ADIWIN_2303 [Winogradskyella psychrotolerans RS-3]|uniref:Uncharacterized protein n=1 Tax=Winogradskyella psychrotolerans RS-3 TaxID=641526 RepID=S7VR56_9FLAO|nr:hypothetical protein ADIWIN_2303 [Winogradskyella psychrotolerans RS-3]
MLVDFPNRAFNSPMVFIFKQTSEKLKEAFVTKVTLKLRCA